MEIEEKTYMAGFNSGYKLAKFQEDLVEMIRPSLSESNEYERGLLEGIQEWEREREKVREAELNELRSENESQDQDLSL